MSRYVFCEPPMALAGGREHLRALAPGETLKPSGLPQGAVALCGRDLGAGWDIVRDVTAATIERLGTPDHEGWAWLCPRCYAAYEQVAS